jgi:hypothetical protein
MLTERGEVASESRRQPAVYIARSTTNAWTRARPSLLSLAAGDRGLPELGARDEALTDDGIHPSSRVEVAREDGAAAQVPRANPERGFGDRRWLGRRRLS